MKRFENDDAENTGTFRRGERLATVLEVARQLEEPGVDVATMSAAIRHYAKNDLMHTYGIAPIGTGANARRLFREDQWVVAAVLGILADAGIRDLDVSRVVSIRLLSWRVDEIPGYLETRKRPDGFPRTPAQDILDDFREAADGVSGWMIRILWARRLTDGRRDVSVQLFNVKTGDRTKSLWDEEWGAEYAPRGEFVIDCDGFLPRIAADRDAMN